MRTFVRPLVACIVSVLFSSTMLFGQWVPSPGYIVQETPLPGYPLDVAVPPPTSSFPPGIYVAISGDLGVIVPGPVTEDDQILRIDPLGAVEVFATFSPATDPFYIEFSEGPSFGDSLYISANNSADQFPLDCGGTILRMEPSGSYSEFTELVASPFPICPIYGELGEPLGLMFHSDQLYVCNSSDFPADIVSITAAGDITPFLDDGVTGGASTYAPFDIVPVPGAVDQFWFADFYDSGRVKSIDIGGQVGAVLANSPTEVFQLETVLGGPERGNVVAMIASTVDAAIRVLDESGNHRTIATIAGGLAFSSGIGTDEYGTIYLVDTEAQVMISFFVDCDQDGVRDLEQISSDPSLDLDGDGALDSCFGGFSRGDCNQDASVDISDSIGLLSDLFAGGVPSGCDKACDSNDDGSKDIGDVIFILGFLFDGGAQPLAPFVTCGADPTADTLTCSFFTACP